MFYCEERFSNYLLWFSAGLLAFSFACSSVLTDEKETEQKPTGDDIAAKYETSSGQSESEDDGATAGTEETSPGQSETEDVGAAASTEETSSGEAEVESWLEESLEFARQQYLSMIETIGPDSQLIPRSTNADGSLRLVKAKDWTSGFFPGSLWYIHEADALLGNDADAATMLGHATTFTEKLESVKSVTNDHDVGFIMYCSYGNGLRLTGKREYQAILLQTADSLATRFSDTVGCTKSWDWWGNADRDFPVIIDNMMNLELLHWASTTIGDSKYHDMAVSHADTTMQNHFRDDFSSYHLVNYDPNTGSVLKKMTYQGYNDDSAWARGQGWALYGFTMSYRETGKQEYLDQAVNVANFIVDHPSLPEDMVPYWDFNDPQIPDTSRDASAGAVYASALFELSSYVSGDDADRFRSAAETIVRSLSSPAFRETVVGQNNGFILKHSVGALNSAHTFEVDVPLNYADYYYLEAAVRMLKLQLAEQ